MTGAAGAGRTRVAALGGGHGLAASLAALRRLDVDITAVVTVADDGGSSGRLRAELGALPPGDLRMALAALAGADPMGEIGIELLQHRFEGTGPLAGHAVGNLLLVGLMDLLPPVAALDLVGRVLGVRGRVLPVSPEPMDIVADVVGCDPADPYAVTEVRGQVAVATTAGRVVSVRPVPPQPAACPEAVAAIAAAEWVILGPGSWFTSVLPHLMVPSIAGALCATPAHRMIVLNLAPQAGETSGFSPESHLEVVTAHAPALNVDVVLADPATVSDVEALRRAAGTMGARVVLAPIAADDGTPRHEPDRLAAAYDGVLRGTGQNSLTATRSADRANPWR